MTDIAETVYLGHSNSIDLQLQIEPAGESKRALTDAEMDAITKVSVTLGGVTVETLAANKATGPIRWRQTGYAAGEIRLLLGNQSLSAAAMSNAFITLHDSDNPDGVVWGSFLVIVKAVVE